MLPLRANVNTGARAINDYSEFHKALSDFLVPYQGHSLGGSYTSTEKQSAHSVAPAAWPVCILTRVYYLRSFARMRVRIHICLYAFEVFVFSFVLWLRGGWNDNTTQKREIRNILKGNSTYINDITWGRVYL